MTRIPAARGPDEWLEVAEGEERVIVGKLLHVNHNLIQLASEDGDVFNIAITPPMFSDLDLFMNLRLLQGAPRAIRAKAVSTGWSAKLVDVLQDVEGHGVSTSAVPGP